jgi:arylsulfatase A-like enzyme
MLVPSGVANQLTQFNSITGLSYRLNPELAREVSGQAWKVDLEHDQRHALVSFPGESLSRQVTVPPDGELRLGVGVLPFGEGLDNGGDSAPATTRYPIRVTVAPEQGSRESVTLLEARPGTADGWLELAAGLADFAGQAIRITLQALPLAADDEPTALIAWANPRVISRKRFRSRPNVILISLDTLRADRLSLNGYSRPTSPNIDAWARRSAINFPNTIAPAPWTLPSHVSMLSGLDAIRHGVDHSRAAPPGMALLPEILHQAGYATAAITGGGLLHPEHGFNQGFDSYWYWDKAPGKTGWGMDLERGFEAVLRALERHADQPFFLFFHTYEIHAPYLPRQPYYQQFGGRYAESLEVAHPSKHSGDKPDGEGFLARFEVRLLPKPESQLPELTVEEMREVASDLYDSGIAHTDEVMGRLLSRLEELGIAEQTLVVLTSDHGESFGEHGVVSHTSLYDHDLKVPLLISLPDRLSGGLTISEQVRLIDIVPTVLDLVGLEAAPGIDGVSLVPLMAGDASAAPPPSWSYAMHQGVSVRSSNRTKYILYNHPWSPSDGADELYDLREDPGELRNLASGDGAELTNLRLQTQQMLGQRPGLRVDLHNSTSGLLTGTLSCQRLRRRQQLRCFPPCQGLEWLDFNQLRFTVGPGESCALLIESASTGSLTITGTVDQNGKEAGQLELDLDLANMSEPAGRSWADGTWRDLTPESSAPSTGVHVYWQGPSATELQEADPDEQLQQQLKALGYVE